MMTRLNLIGYTGLGLTIAALLVVLKINSTRLEACQADVAMIKAYATGQQMQADALAKELQRQRGLRIIQRDRAVREINENHQPNALPAPIADAFRMLCNQGAAC